MPNHNSINWSNKPHHTLWKTKRVDRGLEFLRKVIVEVQQMTTEEYNAFYERAQRYNVYEFSGKPLKQENNHVEEENQTN